MQNKESNKNYQNNKLTIENNKYIERLQLIVIILDYLQLRYNKQLQKYIEIFIELKRQINKETTNKIYKIYKIHKIKNYLKNTNKKFKYLHS